MDREANELQARVWLHRKTIEAIFSQHGRAAVVAYCCDRFGYPPAAAELVANLVCEIDAAS